MSGARSARRRIALKIVRQHATNLAQRTRRPLVSNQHTFRVLKLLPIAGTRADSENKPATVALVILVEIRDHGRTSLRADKTAKIIKSD
jgi:hypothetical protein